MAMEIKSITVHAEVNAGDSREERQSRAKVDAVELERLRRDILRECRRMVAERDRRARER